VRIRSLKDPEWRGPTERGLWSIRSVRCHPRSSTELQYADSAADHTPLRLTERRILSHAVMRGDAGQVTAYGQGGKTRVVLLPATVWRALVLIAGAGGDGCIDQLDLEVGPFVVVGADLGGGGGEDGQGQQVGTQQWEAVREAGGVDERATVLRREALLQPCEVCVA
jgi:hypothetical protein